ncbi:MAG: prkC 23, partial [Gemmataceae bacterium]|nr:prkC 23 [Gemmataceae bacterium]
WLLAAAGREDGTVRLFDRQGREVRTLPGHTGAVHALAVSPDGAAVASGGADDAACVWDVPTGSMRALLRGHDQAVRGVRFGPDGRTLVTASDDGLMKTWDLTADPEGQAALGLPAAVSGVALHPDGRGFAVAFADGTVEVYPDRGRAPRRFPGDGRGAVVGLRFPAAGPPVGVELTGRSAVVWEFGAAPRAVLRAEAPDGSAVTAAAVSAAAGRLAAGDDRGRVTVWSLADRTPQARFDTNLPAPVRHLCFSDDGTWVAAETAGHAVGVWRAGEPDPVYKVSGHGDGMWLVRFLPGGGRLVTAGRGSSIKVWDLAAGKAELSLLGHVGRVTGLAVSPDGRTLVSGSGTGEVKLWDLRTGQELVGLRRHTGPVTAVEFAGDGRMLLTGGMAAGGRGGLAFWDAPRE